jgi:hypothetical protein
MKRHFTYLILTAGLSAMLGSPTLSAQQDRSEIAKIPFAFQANDTTLPAGRYTVTHSVTGGIVTMRENSSGHAIFVKTSPGDESNVSNPRLTFTCYGDDCVLSTIWMPDKAGYAVYAPTHDNLTRKMGLSAQIRSVHLTAR